jgi:hypothetical protein
MFTIKRNVPEYRTIYTKGIKAYGYGSERISNKLSLTTSKTKVFVGMKLRTVTYKSEAHYLKSLLKHNRPATERKARTPKAHVPKLVLKPKALPKPKVTKGPVQIKPVIRPVDLRPEPTFYEMAYSRR